MSSPSKIWGKRPPSAAALPDPAVIGGPAPAAEVLREDVWRDDELPESGFDRIAEPFRGLVQSAGAILPAARGDGSAAELAAELIRQFEGLHRVVGAEVHAYQDPVGIWTIGYGHTRTARAGMVIDRAGADRLLRDDMETAVAAVERLERQCPERLTERQRAALISFAFNVGGGALERSRSVAGRLRSGDYAGAADGLLRYVYAGGARFRGLERRREAERRLFLSDPPRRRSVVETVMDAEPERGEPIEAPGRSLATSTTVAAGGLGAVTAATAATEATTGVIQAAGGLEPDSGRFVVVALLVIVFGALTYVVFERWRKHRRAEDY